MSVTFPVNVELAYERRVFLAVEVIDAVTMTRVSNGLKVVAQGLKGEPIVNRSGFFVWLEEENTVVEKISVDPFELPYEVAEVETVDFPRTTIELQPRVDYQFSFGVTGLRGTLIERRVTPVEPVVDGEVSLRWLDDVGAWQDSSTISRTVSASGDFVSVLRMDPNEKPDVDASGALTVRLKARRGVQSRTSADFKLLQGRVTDPSTADPLTFAWDELQP